MLPLTPPAQARGPKVVAGGDVQEEAVESEGAALENRLTYRKRCVRAIVCDEEWKGTWTSCYHIKLPSFPPRVCGEEGRTELGTPGPH